MKKTIKKRNPQDSTLRNIRALKKRVGKLEEMFVFLQMDVTGMLQLIKNAKPK